MPGAREIHPFLAQGAIAAAAEVKDFAEGGGVAAVVFEELWQCYDIGQTIPEEGAVVGDAGLIGAETGQERTATGIADRVLHVSAVEADGAGGEAVDVGRLDVGVAVAAEGVAEVVDGDEEDVEFLGRRGGVHAAEQKAERSEQNNKLGMFHGVVAVGTGKISVRGCSRRITFPARPVRRRSQSLGRRLWVANDTFSRIGAA